MLTLDLELDQIERALQGNSTPPAERVVSINVQEDKLLANAVMRLKLKRLAMRGVPPREAAKIVDYHEQTVRAIYRDPEFRKEVLMAVDGAFEEVDETFKVQAKTLTEALEEQAFESFNALVDMVRNDNLTANQRIKIHQDFLNRVEVSGHKNTNILKRGEDEVSRADTLARAAQAAREMDTNVQQRISQRKVG